MVELKIIKGKDLKGKKLAKVIDSKNTGCDNYKYKIGMNVDTKELNLIHQFGSGLYFVELKDAINYKTFGSNLAILELNDDEDVVEIREKNENGKISVSYRTHSFTITKIINNFKKKDTRWLEKVNWSLLWLPFLFSKRCWYLNKVVLLLYVTIKMLWKRGVS